MGNLWLFGGAYYLNIGLQANYNDLWKYNPGTNLWTWVNGSDIMNQAGEYGTLGIADIANKPEAKAWATGWSDAAGIFWLFGGNNSNYKMFNDLWKYDPATNRWTWVKGEKVPDKAGVYGVQGVTAATNTPGARYVSHSWADDNGNFWIFGGVGRDIEGTQLWLNDLWRLGNINAVLPITFSSLKAFQQNNQIAVEWKLENETGIKQYTIERSADGRTFTAAGTQVAAANNLRNAAYFWLDASPRQGNNFYRIRSNTVNGETKFSQVVNVFIGNAFSNFVLYPNPVTTGSLQLQFVNKPRGVYDVRIMNTLGQAVMVLQIVHEGGSRTETITLSGKLKKGIYTMEVITPGNDRQSLKFIN